MGRRLAPQAEVVGCGDEPAAEVVGPGPVHEHSRRERVVGSDDAPREIEPPARVAGRGRAAEQFGQPALDHVARPTGIATQENAAVARLGRVAHDHRAGWASRRLDRVAGDRLLELPHFCVLEAAGHPQRLAAWHDQRRSLHPEHPSQFDDRGRVVGLVVGRGSGAAGHLRCHPQDEATVGGGEIAKRGEVGRKHLLAHE